MLVIYKHDFFVHLELGYDWHDFVLFFRNGLSATLTGKVNQLEVILKQLQHDLRKVSSFTSVVPGSLVDLFYLACAACDFKLTCAILLTTPVHAYSY